MLNVEFEREKEKEEEEEEEKKKERERERDYYCFVVIYNIYFIHSYINSVYYIRYKLFYFVAWNYYCNFILVNWHFLNLEQSHQFY